MKILVSYVIYHGDVDRLKRNIKSVVNQVDGVVLVSNDSSLNEEIACLCSDDERIDVIDNHGNLGMAKACNEIFKYALDHGYDWVLTMDQDSDCRDGLIDVYRRYADLSYAGILTCKFMDRNTGEVKGEMPLHHYDGYSEIGKCIQSGAFCSVSAYKHSDEFDEQMFIDEVDRDYCWNLRYHGYRIYEIDFIGIDHTLGKSSMHQIGKHRFVTYDESAFRHYYIARNQLYIHRKYTYRSDLYMLKSEIHSWVKILLYEDYKADKLKARIKGIHDEKKMSVNKKYEIKDIVPEGDKTF